MEVNYIQTHKRVKETLFLKACFNGETDVIDRMIDTIDVNCVDIYGNTALMLACMVDQPWVIDVATRLIDHNIDVDKQTVMGFRALDFVFSRANFNKNLAYLISFHSKYSLGHTFQDGYTYLFSARSLESYKFLVENGANVNCIYEGRTALDNLGHTTETKEYLLSICQ